MHNKPDYDESGGDGGRGGRERGRAGKSRGEAGGGRRGEADRWQRKGRRGRKRPGIRRARPEMENHVTRTPTAGFPLPRCHFSPHKSGFAHGHPSMVWFFAHFWRRLAFYHSEIAHSLDVRFGLILIHETDVSE